jgi:signal transduction histidine kinase
MLDDLGLLPAILWLHDRYARQTGVQVDFRHAGIDKRFNSDVETAAFRIVQEALTNVARHSGVKQAEVRIVSTDDKLTVSVSDKGAGFELKEVVERGDSSGLSGMYERVALLRGTLTIESIPGEGTSLEAMFPLTSEPAVELRR